MQIHLYAGYCFFNIEIEYNKNNKIQLVKFEPFMNSLDIKLLSNQH